MIPEKIHFIFGMSPDFGGKPFSMIHYMAARSAAEVNPFYEINVWYEHEPKSVWWERLRGFVTMHKITAPKEIHGKALIHPAHRADVLRLQLLKQHGGIYLDFDVICIQSFDDLRKNQFVMGTQLNRGLCNATMLATKRAQFIEHWLKAYRFFRSVGRDRYWDEHSVLTPQRLTKRYGRYIRVLPPNAFFYPLWGGMPEFVLGEDKRCTRDSYSVHLWETLCWDLYKDLTPEQLVAGTSEFARLTKNLVREFCHDGNDGTQDFCSRANQGSPGCSESILTIDGVYTCTAGCCGDVNPRQCQRDTEISDLFEALPIRQGESEALPIGNEQRSGGRPELPDEAGTGGHVLDSRLGCSDKEPDMPELDV